MGKTANSADNTDIVQTGWLKSRLGGHRIAWCGETDTAEEGNGRMQVGVSGDHTFAGSLP